MNKNVISLSKFLSRYGSLSGEKLAKLKHEDVKVLFPQFERVSFDEIERNRDLLTSGDVVLVSDGKHTIPYKTPVLSDDYDAFETHDVNMEELPKFEVDNSVHDYVHMNEYELRQLLRRKFNSTSNQMAARRELNRRGITLSKKYKRSDYSRIKIEEE